jgi:hypothetical protein
MSEGGLSFHREGKGLGAGRWEKGLKRRNNILLLFQKNMCHLYFFYPKFLTKGRMRAGGTHVVSRATSVNPGTCE